jgi:deferrochelatase/peroxidase EfeB
MSAGDQGSPRPTRRGFLAATAGLVAGTAGATATLAAPADPSLAMAGDGAHPFHGRHQAGIATPAQAHTYFAALDLTTTKRADVVALLQVWTAAAARLTAGLPIESFAQTDYAYATPPATGTVTTSAEADPVVTTVPAPDSGEAAGLGPSRLTLTFGFGPGLFEKDGKDRYGLARHRPDALGDLPHFVGDQLVPAHSGGDLSIQACADDPQIAFHAVRQLVRLAYDLADLRWTQTGFMPDPGPGKTPRNLMGFRDGTNNIRVDDTEALDRFVWVGTEGPAWMRGGSYLVARRIRIALEHWDRTRVAFQEQTVGRHKDSGAPLGQVDENAPVDLAAADKDGKPLIPENSHVRLALPASNGGARILRRPYSYNDGINMTAERWPPWRQAMEYDAGLFFLCYQRDPRTGFTRIFEPMAKFDMMNQFVTHVGGGLFACPAGVDEGGFIGQGLFIL